MLTIDDVKALFRDEFGQLSERFYDFVVSAKEARNSCNDNEARPGVYIFWHPDFGVLKTGKSQSNSRKRALEHFRDNTSYENIKMAELGEDPKTTILLLNIRNDRDLHWVLALEAFMEWHASPKIRSARMG